MLVIDDFERALEVEKPFPHPIYPDYVGTIRAVVRAFRRAEGTRSGLIFTCRHTFQLKTGGGEDLARYLFHLPVGPMETHEGLKQVEAKSRNLGVAPETLDAETTDRIIRAAQGNPGLQDLLFQMYLGAKQQRDRNPEDPVDAMQALNDILQEMEIYAQSGKFPEKQELYEFLGNLAIDRMLALLGEGERKLLEASTLFELPVPVKILEAVANQCGYFADEPFAFRLFGLGLWEQFEGMFDREERAAGANALSRARLEKLSDEDAKTLSSIAIEPLFEAWGDKRDPTAPWPLIGSCPDWHCWPSRRRSSRTLPPMPSAFWKNSF